MLNENNTEALSSIDYNITKKYMTFAFAKRYGVLLLDICQEQQHAQVAYRDDVKSVGFIELQRHINIPLVLIKLSDEKFNKLLSEAFETDSSVAMQLAQDMTEEDDLMRLIQHIPKKTDLLESEDDAPIIRLINALFTQAIKQNASDIHIETFEEKMLVRFRIDGILREVIQPQRVFSALIISRIKVMAKLDIAEKRLPQDGRISLRIASRNIDVRVSTLPSSHGERVVMRLLDKNNARLDLHHLGMSEQNLILTRSLISRPHGIILVTGPTGSGKTTSLYAMLTELNDPTRNMLTVEDPIEYDLPGVGQTQVNVKVNMTFARGLRSILRQDPDVIMVGEIRDLETAQIAVQASLTGHLVLSTLHTNSASGAITRLRDMGVEPFLLASSLLGVIAQRLVRLLCPHCKRKHVLDANEAELLHLKQTKKMIIYQPEPNGCSHCEQLGYSKRSGIYEIFKIDDELRRMIHDDVSEQKIINVIRKKYPSMHEDGTRRILAGETSIAEVLRVAEGG